MTLPFRNEFFDEFNHSFIFLGSIGFVVGRYQVEVMTISKARSRMTGTHLPLVEQAKSPLRPQMNVIELRSG
jgi:hypothetical protein